MFKRSQSYFPGGAAVVFAALCLLLLPWLGETFFYSKGEPREAIVAVSMLHSGNWILPENYGGDIPYKPPFMGWLIAAFAWLFNGGVVNEYISRLPSALAAIAMVMGGYAWAKRERDTRFAVIFSFVTIGCFEVFRASVACRLDMVLTACMVGAIYLMYHIREHSPAHKGWLYVAVILLLTCATLTKGPVGALLPCLVIGIYRLLRRDSFFPTLFKMLGLAFAALALTSWWYIAAYQQGGKEFAELMYEENIGRLTGTMSYESHIKPFWYNFVTLIAGLLPWTLLLLAACFVRRNGRHVGRLSTAALLSIVAAVVIVGFYCIPASKRSVYLLPAYPFICYGIASVIESKTSARAVRFFTWLMAVLAVLAPLAIIALQIWPLPKLPIDTIPWWGYAILSLPLFVGIAWFANRHSPTGHLCIIVWAIYVAYIAVGMPAILNPKSDIKALPTLTAGPTAKVLSLNPGIQYRFYSLNFYLDDHIRAIDNLAEAATEPPGTLVLIPMPADTTGLSRNFTFEPLLKRSADHRNPVGLAIKK